jgi:hypothetical protein
LHYLPRAPVCLVTGFRITPYQVSLAVMMMMMITIIIITIITIIIIIIIIISS